MVKRKRTNKKSVLTLITPERMRKSDVIIRPDKKPQIRNYGERLMARSVINANQLEAWTRIEQLAEGAEYHSRPKGSRLDSIGGGIELAETEKYINARRALSRLFASLGLMGTSVIEFIVIMGEDAETFAQRVPGWNRHKILGALSIALDIAVNVLGIGYKEDVPVVPAGFRNPT